ncbi:Gat2p [Sugiyamaella lignohabitans]|uniref:Gat2p n=1 Tax=Sugiyamaella lignohabitans TaxID=796027 RepID=A0A167DPJ2_9ASCO|nr:Gat2p [Sugiyamaella lignohabitans]ANB13141.1 Gat2p [Sugiyamaella lignohabitans]
MSTATISSGGPVTGHNTVGINNSNGPNSPSRSNSSDYGSSQARQVDIHPNLKPLAVSSNGNSNPGSIASTPKLSNTSGPVSGGYFDQERKGPVHSIANNQSSYHDSERKSSMPYIRVPPLSGPGISNPQSNVPSPTSSQTISPTRATEMSRMSAPIGYTSAQPSGTNTPMYNSNQSYHMNAINTSLVYNQQQTQSPIHSVPPSTNVSYSNPFNNGMHNPHQHIDQGSVHPQHGNMVPPQDYNNHGQVVDTDPASHFTEIEDTASHLYHFVSTAKNDTEGPVLDNLHRLIERVRFAGEVLEHWYIRLYDHHKQIADAHQAQAQAQQQQQQQSNQYNNGYDFHRSHSQELDVDGNNNRRHSRKRTRSSPREEIHCHQCGITDTPEWRRGPDGARTLCNACGLYHAKLVKKKGETEAAEILRERKDFRASQANNNGNANSGSTSMTAGTVMGTNMPNTSLPIVSPRTPPSHVEQ